MGTDRQQQTSLFSPRVSLIANLALVFAGATLSLLEVVGSTTGAIIVLLGFLGVATSVYGTSSGT